MAAALSPAAWPARAADEDQGAAGAAAPAQEHSYPYQTEIVGLSAGEEDLKDLLRRASQLVGLAEQPPPTPAALRRRAKDDMDRLESALRSEGFYDAEADFEIAPPAQTDDPAQVTVRVEPGTVYLLSAVDIAYRGGTPAGIDGIPQAPADLGLELGMRARAPEIKRAQGRILDALETHGFPQAEVSERSAVIDRERKTLRVDWQVRPGPLVEFGEMRVQGLDSVEEKYVRSFRAWTPGTRYDRSQVEATRAALVGTGLFKGVQVETAEVAGARGTAPVTFRFEERAHRSIGFGARVSTSEGPSANAFWEHRNALGQQERVRLEAEAGLLEQRLTADLRKPRFQRDDQSLLSTTEARRHDTDAFEEFSLGTTLSLEREFDELWTGTLGGSTELTQVTDNEGQRTFFLVGAPASLTRDSRDNLLEPTRGSHLQIATTPYLATLEATTPFLRTIIGGATYHALDDDDRFVLAGRARVGSIVGTETENVPASKRFYAGGGGSIRGFPFEEVGPLDAQNDPLGGRSLLELGVEMRIRITEDIGIVPFLDAGNVYDGVIPDFDEPGDPLRYGAGLGLRYYTAIGPLRLDVAVPLNKRDVDNDFEIYISLGQAF